MLRGGIVEIISTYPLKEYGLWKACWAWMKCHKWTTGLLILLNPLVSTLLVPKSLAILIFLCVAVVGAWGLGFFSIFAGWGTKTQILTAFVGSIVGVLPLLADNGHVAWRLRSISLDST